MADDTWRYAEPDGKQRALSLDDLQRSLSKGLLPTNVPVWRAGFEDWTPAAEVPELRASVASGARIIPPKGAQRPGRPVAQRGGAAAQGEEPMSPPSYTPARKARPSAPALDLGKTAESTGNDSGKMRSRASTLLIAGGAPARDHNPESEAAPINVPGPEGAPAEAGNIITRPPPVGDGTAQVVPAIPGSSGKLRVADGTPDLDDAETREMPAVQRATLREQAWSDENPSAPALDVSSSMLLPDTSSVPTLSGSVLVPADDSSAELPPPDSTEEIPEADVISTREPAVKRPTTPPPLRSSRPSHPNLSPSGRPASSPALPRPSKAPSFPSRAEVLGSTPAPGSAKDVAERIGLKSKPPPPDINPLSSDFPPPPGVPVELHDDDKTDPSLRRKREAELAAKRASQPPPRSEVPLWGAVAAVVAVGGGVWFLAKSGEPETPSVPVPVASSAPVAAPAVDAGTHKAELACQVRVSARPIVEDVVQPVGLEVVRSDAQIAVGYAKSEREAAAALLDGASLAVASTVTAKAPAAIQRVVPRLEGGKLEALPEYPAMTKGITLQRRADEIALGIGKNKLLRIGADGTPEELFTLPTNEVDALRVSGIPGAKNDAAYTYRAPGAVWFGTTKKDDPPQRVPGLGTRVGSPTLVALDGTHVLVAWADRPSDDAKWSIRIAAYSPGKGNVTPVLFEPPQRKGAALSPALARIDNEHALLLWTAEHVKGDDRSYEVVAQQLDAKAQAVGEPFAVSAADMSAGQAQGALDANGRGTVAFLVARGDSYDIAVAGVECK